MGLLSKVHSQAIVANRHAVVGLTSRLPVVKGGRFCEIGPGPTNVLLQIADRFRPSGLYGLEYPGYETAAADAGLTMLTCDLQTDRWPCDDAMFDLVVSNQVLEHMADTDHFFEELGRIVKPGGYAVVSTPNLSSWISILLLLATIQPPICYVSDRWVGLGNPLSSMRRAKREFATHAHLRLFTIRALREMAEVYGFQTVKISGDTFGLPLIGRLLAWIDPWHGLFATVALRKNDAIAE
jgi:SAM-dependent methyltransferase